MKKIYLTLIILLMAMIGMAYVYFSNLNRESFNHEVSLYAATANSGLIFSLQNDKSVFDILKGQDLFQQLIGTAKFDQLSALKNELLTDRSIHPLVANTNIYLSFIPGKNKDIDYLISTQLNQEEEKPMLLSALKAKGVKISEDQGLMKLAINDSTTFYLALEKNLILLSNTAAPIKSTLEAIPKKQKQEFITYIKSHSKHSKNSLANLFIDFNNLPPLLQSILPGKISGNLEIFNQQHSFSALDYNFSKERIYFNGNSQLNDQKNYLSLFAAQAPQKNTIDNLLPENTANFRLFSVPDYKTWRKSLSNWFIAHQEEAKIKKVIKDTEQEYRLDAETIFPKYFKDQLITFQLKSAEQLGAINLSNGDKVAQLLLDLSENYTDDIKLFKKTGLLYAYFGEPFKKFNKPYYTIIDNYLVFANQPSTLQSFISAYRSNKLLVNTADYIDLYSQISNTASITFYVNQKNSADLVLHNFYRPYYNHFNAAAGLKKFSSFIYQLSGDQGTFQTNVLVNTFPQAQTNPTPETIPEDLTNK